MAEQYRMKYVDVEAAQFDGTKASQDELVAFADGKTAGTVTRTMHKGSWNDGTPEPALTVKDEDGTDVVLLKSDWLVVHAGRLLKYSDDRFVTMFNRLEQ